MAHLGVRGWVYIVSDFISRMFNLQFFTATSVGEGGFICLIPNTTDLAKIAATYLVPLLMTAGLYAIDFCFWLYLRHQSWTLKLQEERRSLCRTETAEDANCDLQTDGEEKNEDSKLKRSLLASGESNSSHNIASANLKNASRQPTFASGGSLADSEHGSTVSRVSSVFQSGGADHARDSKREPLLNPSHNSPSNSEKQQWASSNSATWASSKSVDDSHGRGGFSSMGDIRTDSRLAPALKQKWILQRYRRGAATAKLALFAYSSVTSSTFQLLRCEQVLLSPLHYHTRHFF